MDILDLKYILERRKYFSVGTAIRRENTMKQLKTIMLLLIILVMTNCTKLEFDSFDPMTSTLRWIITNERN
jgi:hypothetical protein